MVDILLVGAGGYGNVYAEALLNSPQRTDYRIVGVAEPKPESCEAVPELKKRGIPIYPSIEEFYAANTADLAIISSPIQFHCSQTCLALSKGSGVLCEKPLSATVQDALSMLEARDKYKKLVAIGYQWSYSNAILRLKKDIMEGLFGKPKRLKTLVLWPRNADYYSRGWAGKKRDAAGNWILDSVANNATAHYLHNMFYVLGGTIDRSAAPKFVTAELYRANAIENFDTSVMRVITEEGIELMYYVSHAVNKIHNPTFLYEFEKAVISYSDGEDSENKSIKAVFTDGSVKTYGDPQKEEINKLWAVIDSMEKGVPVACGIEAAMSHTIAINGAQDSMEDILEFPGSIVKYDEREKLTWVEGLGSLLTDCYRDWSMPGEKGISWAKSGSKIDLAGYRSYPGIAGLVR